MQLFKKHWKSALFLLLWGLINAFFDPRQRKYYLAADIQDFEYRAHWILVGIEIILLGCFLIFVILKNRPSKELLSVSIGSVVGLFLFYIFFQNTFTSIGLYVNRQFGQSDVKKRYVVQFLNNEPEKYNLFLYDIDQKQIITDSKLLGQVSHLGLHQNDTVQIAFKKGLLGADFFEK